MHAACSLRENGNDMIIMIIVTIPSLQCQFLFSVFGSFGNDRNDTALGYTYLIVELDGEMPDLAGMLSGKYIAPPCITLLPHQEVSVIDKQCLRFFPWQRSMVELLILQRYLGRLAVSLCIGTKAIQLQFRTKLSLIWPFTFFYLSGFCNCILSHNNETQAKKTPYRSGFYKYNLVST